MICLTGEQRNPRDWEGKATKTGFIIFQEHDGDQRCIVPLSLELRRSIAGWGPFCSSEPRLIRVSVEGAGVLSIVQGGNLPPTAHLRQQLTLVLELTRVKRYLCVTNMGLFIPWAVEDKATPPLRRSFWRASIVTRSATKYNIIVIYADL